jgi:hypothetical protein
MKDLNDLDIKEDDTIEQIVQKYLDKLCITMDQMKEVLSVATQNKAEEIALELTNIAPLGKYEDLIEDNEGMANFLKTEAYKPEHWGLLKIDSTNSNLVKFIFACNAVDEGESVNGFVFVSESGKIRHAFVQSME